MSDARKSIVYALLLTTAAWSIPACAQEQPGTPPTDKDAASSQDSGLGEIIVTAQKRAESVQQVPIAVTAVRGTELAQRGITDASGLMAVAPNIGFNRAAGETRIAIRGITFDNIAGTGAEARVPYHVDGVYLSRSGNINGTFFDVDRIEVLRGPQGTLFGRNAIAGAVNLITRDPTDYFSGYLQTDVGNYNSVIAEGAVSGPISDGISIRIAGRSLDHDGYGTNLTTGHESDNAKGRDLRFKIKFEPSSRVKVVLSADYSSIKGNFGYFFGGFARPEDPINNPPVPGVYPNPNNLRNITSDTDPYTSNRYYGFGANAEIGLTDDIKLISISSYRNTKEINFADFDYSSLPFLQGTFADKARQFSQELRIQGDYKWGNVMVGLFYFDDKYTGGSHATFNLFNPALGNNGIVDGVRYGGTLRTKSYAAFAQATYNFSDSLHLTVGARYTKDDKSRSDAYFQAPPSSANTLRAPLTDPYAVNIDPAFVQPFTKKSWGNFSPRVTLAYDFNRDVNVYATFSKGFKSGGFQAGLDNALPPPGQEGNGFNPETLTDYEVGMKGDFLDRHLRVNLAGFYYDYKNLQVLQTTTGIGAVLKNAASAKLYGVEAEIKALPVENLQFDLSGAAMKSEFTDFITGDPTRPFLGNINLSGNRLPSAPAYNFAAGIQLTVPSGIGDFVLRGETQTQSRIYFDAYENKNVSSSAYTLVNAFLNWENPAKKVYASIYIKNIGNVFRYQGGFPGNAFFGSPVQVSFIAPRTFGGRIGVRF